MPLYTLIPPVTQCINCLDSYLRTTLRLPLDLIIFIYIQGYHLIIFIYIQGYHYRRSLFSLLHQFSLSVWFFPSAYKSAIFLPFQKKGGEPLLVSYFPPSLFSISLFPLIPIPLFSFTHETLSGLLPPNTIKIVLVMIINLLM